MKKLLFVFLVLSVFTINAQVPSYVPTNGLVAYYPFNGNANDASGNGNNGTVNGATLTSDRFGNVGKAYSFNGISNNIIVQNSPTLQINEWSIHAWFKTQFLGYNRITSKDSPSNPNNDLSLIILNGNLFISSSINGITNTPLPLCNTFLADNNWHNVIAVRSAGKYYIYIDGSVCSIVSDNFSNLTNSNPLYIGSPSPYPSQYFNGELDDIAIYNRALSQSEITQLYNSNSCIANITNNDTTICRGSSVTLNAATVNSASVTDINGNVYPTVNIGSQTWMQKNLNVSKYKNGDIIPQVTNATQWAGLTTGAWCWWNNDSATYAVKYGKLYNWYAVNDPRGLAPEGWHIPKSFEWNRMTKYLDPTVDTVCSYYCWSGSSIGNNMKNNSGWNNGGNGANTSGFSALPGGYRSDLGSFEYVGYHGCWWSSADVDTSVIWSRFLFYDYSVIDLDSRYNKKHGISVRAIQNTLTYLWSTGATTPSIAVSPTVTTKYYCTVSDGVNTCKDSVTVTVSTIPTNLITADTIKVCGTSTTISATTGLSSYAWSNGANTAPTTVTSSGWYKCTASNGVCTVVDSVYVSLFNPKITQNDTTVCAGTPLTLTVNDNTAITSSLPANLRNGLVGYWPFNGNANDESGNGNHGTVNGATLTSDRFGNVGKAYSFNGSGAFINVPNSSSLQFNSQITISIWLNAFILNSPANYLLSKGADGGTPYSWTMPAWPTGLMELNLWNNNNGNYTISTSTPISTNQWRNVVITYDGIMGKTYLDGQLNNSVPFTASVFSNIYDLKFGRRHTSGLPYFFNGKLDDIAIYNHALTATEIQQLYSGYSYLWSTNATTPSITVTPTATTSYIATVSNGINTCKDTVKITVAPITSNLITADTIKVCGTSTTISATTGLSTYAWSNGASTASTTVTSSGWYKCTATNGACTAKDSVYVSLFNPKITQNDTTVCAGTPLTLTVNNNTSLTSSLPANLRNGLVGYWPFNGNANDESGNGNNGTVNGATLTSDRFGNVGKAYSFDGSSFISVANSNSINFTNQFTLNAWMNSSSLNPNQGILGKGQNLTQTGYALLHRVDDNQTGISMQTNSPIIQAYSFTLPNQIIVNTWNLITGTYDGNVLKLFVNGVLVTSFNSNISLTPNPLTSLLFGCELTNFRFFTGKLDDVAIFNRVLSASEVQQLYSGATYLWSTTATTPSITVTPTATTSYIATVSNGINTCKDTVKITVTNITSLAPTVIYGAVDVCSAIGTDTASIPVNYKINKIANAASYVWTVPAGATLLSGQGDTSIIVRFSSSFVSGAITVKSVSTCNVSSALKSVTVYKRVAAAPTAIQNQFTPTSILATTNVTGLVSEVYRIKKVLYATSYNWYLNRGTSATITHINAAGVNDTAVIVTFASCFVKDTLSVKSVSPCSISTAKTVIMSSSTTPTTVAGITTVGGDFVVCIGSSKTFTAISSTPTSTQTPIASYRWTKPVNTTITSASSDSSSITVSFNTGFTGGNLTCKGVSACGVIGTTASTGVLQYLPPTPLSIGSSTNSYNACINSSVTYTALLVSAPTTAQATATVFRWTKPNNTTISSASADSSSITVRFNTGYTGGIISVKGQSRCGTQSAARTQALTHTGCAIGTKMSQLITSSSNNSFEVSLYPNPTANAFKLLIKSSKASGLSTTNAIVKVIDIQGRMIKSFQANTNQVIAIGNELKPGVYMVEVRLGEEVKTIRAVKF